MMEYKGYIATVEFDDDAGILHGEVVNTRDVITFEGDTVPDIRKAFRESVEEYLAFCAERGEEPDKPFSGGIYSARIANTASRRFYQGAEISQEPEPVGWRPDRGRACGILITQR